MLVVFNPLNRPVEKTLRVNLYYTGLTQAARVRAPGQAAKSFKLNRDYTIDLPVRVPAQGMSWFVME
jgi:hypothetical protein